MDIEINASSLVAIQQENPKEMIKHKQVVSTVDTELYLSGLRVSNSKVFSSEDRKPELDWKLLYCEYRDE